MDSPRRQTLVDLWSVSNGYRSTQQREDEIEQIVGLLDLSRASSLADVGCGNGAYAIAAARKHPSCEVFAYDALESAVAECRKQSSGLDPSRFHTGVAWAESLPLPDASVDRVLSRAVLHHVTDPAAAYAEIARILKPGGLVLLQAPCNYWDKATGNLLTAMHLLMDSSHTRRYHQAAEIVAGMNDAGLAMARAACWPYDFGIDDAMAEFVRTHNLQKRFQLRQTSDSGWSVRLYWCRVIATKSRD
jgi:ubiquinone/menaquinone biosynthesis C-methylase UbiE